MEKLFPAIPFIILALLVAVSIINATKPAIFKTRKQKEEDKEDRLREAKEVREEIFGNLRFEVWQKFAVELDTIHGAYSQSEIVRIVNLLAYRTAVACMNQDKEGRGLKIPRPWNESPNGHTWQVSWDTEARNLKREWSESRKLAFQIIPELKDQMPHFSEFEPLKSYNAEHRLKSNSKLVV